MKKTMLILWAGLICCTTLVNAQEAEKKTFTPYYRNALTNMMIYHPEDEFGYDVYSIFRNLPEDDKYDAHDVELKVIDNSLVTNVRNKASGFHRQTYGGSIVLTSDEKQANADALLALLNEAEVGKRIVARWFNLTGNTVQDAHFDIDKIVARNDNNASFQEIAYARQTIEGTAILQDMSDELINHSFVLVSDMTYITAEDRASAAKSTIGVLGAVFDAFVGGNSGQRMAETAEDIADAFTGFKVMTHSYLFQLVWNDSISNIFYSRYYTSEPNPERIKAFLRDESSFRLVYLGTESANAEKTKLIDRYTRDELLQMITVRSIDKNVAKLQKRFESFRVKAPIIAIEYDKKGNAVGYRAQIGQKEGVEDNMKFEVLEARVVKGRLEYRRVAVLKPVRNQIWDNRFNALIEQEKGGELQGTLFKLDSKSVGASIYPGMLIRQING